MKIGLFIGFAIVLYIIYKRSIKRIDSDLASAPIDYTSRGLHKFKQRNYQGALDDYTKAIQNNPKNWIAYSNRGNTYSVMHHDAQTNEEKLRLIELATNDFKASLKIKSYKDGNQKALSNLQALEKDIRWLEKDITRENNQYKEALQQQKKEKVNVQKLSNYANNAQKDFEIRQESLQERLRNISPEQEKEDRERVLNSLLKKMSNEERVVFMNEMMEAQNKANRFKSHPINENAEFGHSFNNPIVVSSILNGYKYLSGLRTFNGNPVTFERQGSEINSNGAHIDKYEIYERGNYITNLYINCYGSKNSEQVPKGFILLT